jgi:hypothetical protein
MDQQPTKPIDDELDPKAMSEHEGEGTARRPEDELDKNRESTETIPRKSSLF